jgi:hypothetical protein
MNQVPSWPNLKHFQSITTMDFSDAQGYLDALKVSFMLQLAYVTIPYKDIL